MKKGKILALMLSLWVSASVGVASVSADVKIDNDGMIQDNPYGKNESIPPTYQGVDYYDVYLPYAQTYGEVGGWATSGTAWSTEMWVMQRKDTLYSADKIMTERDMCTEYGYSHRLTDGTGSKFLSHDDVDNCVLQDKSGNKLYVIAPPFIVSNVDTTALKPQDRSLCSANPSKGGYFAGQGGSLCQYLDVIFTDGTVWTCVVGDAAATQHTNGGAYQNDTMAIDGVYYQFDNTILDKHIPYASCFQAAGGNCVEIWGKDLSALMNKYNLCTWGQFEKSTKPSLNETTWNHVAYYRMYNAKLGDNMKLNVSEAKDVAYSLGKVTFAKGVNTGSGKEEVAFTVNGMTGYDEAYFVDPEVKPFENNILLLGNDSLTCYEKEQLYYWKQNLSLKAEQQAKSVPRVILMVVAIAIIFYALTLLVFHQMDILNSFVDIEFLGMITMKKMKAVRAEDLKGNSNTMKFTEGKYKVNGVWYVTLREILTVDVALISISVYILSGRMFLHLNNLTDFVLDFFSKIF